MKEDNNFFEGFFSAVIWMGMISVALVEASGMEAIAVVAVAGRGGSPRT